MEARARAQDKVRLVEHELEELIFADEHLMLAIDAGLVKPAFKTPRGFYAELRKRVTEMSTK